MKKIVISVFGLLVITAIVNASPFFQIDAGVLTPPVPAGMPVPPRPVRSGSVESETEKPTEEQEKLEGSESVYWGFGYPYYYGLYPRYYYHYPLVYVGK